jgi:hypothetical protein
MIVRISGEDQYRIDDSHRARLNELDNAVVAVVENGAQDGFQASYNELLEFVRAQGERLADDELAGSDLILPPADISLEEAAKDFTGEGLIPD